MKVKALIEVERTIWANVKFFATMERLSLNSAVELLLTEAVSSRGYPVSSKGGGKTAS
jgi:hypothetical protein